MGNAAGGNGVRSPCACRPPLDWPCGNGPKQLQIQPHTHTHTHAAWNTPHGLEQAAGEAEGEGRRLFCPLPSNLSTAPSTISAQVTHTLSHTHTHSCTGKYTVFLDSPFSGGPPHQRGRPRVCWSRAEWFFFSLDFFFIERTARHTHTDTRATASTWSACSCLFHRQEKPND